ncbi:MAG: class I SAM-dependent methyltransferase [Gemmatimonadota bacterium]
MSLSSDYKRQFGWRDWPTIFDALPPLQGQSVLDLGCGVGDLAAEFVARGARVIGVDMNEELLREAQSRRLANAEFRKADLRTLTDLGDAVGGLWCSFTAAYFPGLPVALASWEKYLQPGGWAALTEIDDLFGHEPLGARTKSLLEAYARDAFVAGRHDFHMGRKLGDHLGRSGFTVSEVFTVDDREFSFVGPAHPEVLDAWRNRFDRMKLLRDFCGSEFEQVRQEFLACLMHADHRSVAKVFCCIATK